MLDPQLLRNNPDDVKKAMQKHGADLDLDIFNQLETQRKEIQIRTQNLQNERNKRSKSIGIAKAKGEDIQPLLDSVSQLGDDLKAAEVELQGILSELHDIQMSLPNVLAEEVPDGKDEDDNILF